VGDGLGPEVTRARSPALSCDCLGWKGEGLGWEHPAVKFNGDWAVGSRGYEAEYDGRTGAGVALRDELGLTRNVTGFLTGGRFVIRYSSPNHFSAAADDLSIPAAAAAGHNSKFDIFPMRAVLTVLATFAVVAAHDPSRASY